MLLLGLDIRAFIAACVKTEKASVTTVPAFTVGHFLDDTSPMPEDLILPRVLTWGGLMVFGGAPKVGKSDFLLSLLSHMAAGVTATCEAIHSHFSDLGVDIIVVDPLRNVFDGGEGDAGENDNAAMLFFLQQRLDSLRDAVNLPGPSFFPPHTQNPRKVAGKRSVSRLSGAGSLQGYYTTGLIMFQLDENQSYRQLIFELRNGPRLRSKVINKVDGAWQKMEYSSDRLVGRSYGEKLDAGRRRKRDVILEIIHEKSALVVCTP